MQGAPVDAGPDPAGRERANELVAARRQVVEAEPERVEMPGVLAVRALARNLDLLEIGEGRVVAARDRRALRPEAVGPGELPEPECGRHVRHVVLEAGRRNRVVPAAPGAKARPGIARHPVQAEAPDGALEGGSGGRRHAALARGDGLVGVEREPGYVG